LACRTTAGCRVRYPTRLQPVGRSGWRISSGRDLPVARSAGPAYAQRPGGRERASPGWRAAAPRGSRSRKDPGPWRCPTGASRSPAGAASAGAIFLDGIGHLTARGASPSAFDRRCIPPGCVARRSNIGHILASRALPSGRITGLGAATHLHHWLLSPRTQGIRRSRLDVARRRAMLRTSRCRYTRQHLRAECSPGDSATRQ